jgi:glutaminyl-peptide cyclotransferase
MTIFFRFFSFICAILLLCCCNERAPHRNAASQAEVKTITGVESPANGTIITCGDSVEIRLTQPAAGNTIDSLVILSGKNNHLSIHGNSLHGWWHSGKNRVGQVTLKLQVFYNDSLRESHAASLVILSDIVPQVYKYKVVRQFPHDGDAYTQGLIYDNGKLYESTGLEEKSSVRIVDIASGKPEKLVPLQAEFFGEGIAFYGNELFQITYKSQVGFVYDRKTLAQLRSFDYSIKEGWGLTAYKNYLVMSDGSSQLYFMDPEFFTQVDKIDVFNNKGMVPSLNELECVNGSILANVYGESYIVMIDPASGKVTGTLDLHELMPKGSEGDMNQVLNGIAWNPATRHLYVTGKHWKSLYELEVTPSL